MVLSIRGFHWRSSVSLIGRYCRGIRMSAPARAKEILNEMKEKNPYYDKYAEKIAKLQKSSPQEFLDRIDKVDPQKKSVAKEPKRLVGI